MNDDTLQVNSDGSDPQPPVHRGFFLLADLADALCDLEDLANRLEHWARKLRLMHHDGVELINPDDSSEELIWVSTQDSDVADYWELPGDDRSPLSMS